MSLFENINITFYFQKHNFKYCFGNDTITHSVKFLVAHREKSSAVPSTASGPTVWASEALSSIGAEIEKAADMKKKRRLDILDREGVDRQNNDMTKRVRPDIEDKEIETMTGQSGVDVSAPPLSASEVDDITPSQPLTPYKGNYLYSNLLYDLDNVPDELYDVDNVTDNSFKFDNDLIFILLQMMCP